MVSARCLTCSQLQSVGKLQLDSTRFRQKLYDMIDLLCYLKGDKYENAIKYKKGLREAATCCRNVEDNGS